MRTFFVTRLPTQALIKLVISSGGIDTVKMVR